MAKKGQTFKKYSPEFKISVIMDMSTNGLSYHETVRKYNLGDDSIGGTRQMVHRWETHIFGRRNRRFYEAA